MSLNKMFVFIFVFLGLFGVLLVTMPSEFVSLGVTSKVQDKEVAKFFSSHNITTYNYTLSVELSYPGNKIYEGLDFGMPADQAIEFWWNTEAAFYSVDYLEVRHLTKSWWWWATHRLTVTEAYASKLPEASNPDVGLRRWDVVDYLYDEAMKASYCEFECQHMNVKLFIAPYNESWTMAESWDNGKLLLYTSYDIDWTQTSINMWHIMFQLMAFQNPDLGIPGTGGFILNTAVSLSLWASIAVLAFAFATSIIPLIRGWAGT